MLLIPFFKEVKADHERVIQPVDDVLRGKAVPDAHQKEQQDISDIGNSHPVCDPFFLRHPKDKAHEDVVSEPEGKRHMPAVPEIFNIAADERLIKVFRGFDSHDIADADRKSRVSGEIKKQIKAVRIHVCQSMREAAGSQKRQFHYDIRINAVADNEFVQKAEKNFIDSFVKQFFVLLLCPNRLIVFFKTAVPVDRT